MAVSTSPSDQPLVETESGKFGDGVEYFAKRWSTTTSATPKALVIFLHGFAEHVARYDHVWPLFAARNIEAFGYDQRGFGRSGPRYGDTTLEQQVSDLAYIVGQQRARLNERFAKTRVPIYLYGHSMGGCVILSLFTHITNFDDTSSPINELMSGVVCSAPLIKRTKPPSNILLWLLPKLAWLYPNMRFNKTIDATHLTSDPEAAKSAHSDPLVRGDVYIKTVSGMVMAGYDMLDTGYKNWPRELPILITHGEKDLSASPEASRELIELINAKDKEFKLWPGMLHEGHNEIAGLRDPFLEYTLKWMIARQPE